MTETTSRLLKLLALLQVRQEWSGPDLALRLEVTERTIRNDIERLRDLGYPVEARRGPIGGYRLGAGAEMPPLLLADDEAIAIAVSLATVGERGIGGLEEASQRALTKLRQVLPTRLRTRVAALQESTSRVVLDPTPGAASPEILQILATATRQRETQRIHYTRHDGATSRRLVDPTRLVNWDTRWYLLAWDHERDAWRTFRVDRIDRTDPTGRIFGSRELPAADVTRWISDNVARAGWDHTATIRIDAPATHVAARIPSQMGSVEAVDDNTCRLHTGADDLASIAMWMAILDAEFTVESPSELAGIVRALGERYVRAVTPQNQASARCHAIGQQETSAERRCR